MPLAVPDVTTLSPDTSQAFVGFAEPSPPEHVMLASEFVRASVSPVFTSRDTVRDVVFVIYPSEASSHGGGGV